jgi:hypothetical protein
MIADKASDLIRGKSMPEAAKVPEHVVTWQAR